MTMMSNQRILFLVSILDTGGLELYLLRLIRYLAQIGWQGQIDVLCKSGIEGALAPQFRQLGTSVIPLEQSYFDVRHWLQLFSLMRRKRYHAVCDFTGDFAGIPLFLAAQAGVPCRICFYRSSQHQFDLSLLKRGYWKLVHALSLKFATSMLSNSEAAFDSFCPGWRESKSSRFEVIQNAMTTTAFETPLDREALRRELGLPPGKLVIGHVGRYVAAKNHPAFLQMAQLMRERRDDVVFLLCGPGVKTNLQSAITDVTLARNIILHDTRHDIPNVLRCMDAFFFPSLNEGQPNALLEAVLAGVPFVASDIPSHRESLPEWLHDRLVPVDDVRPAVEKLCAGFDDAKATETLMKRASEWAREMYAPEKCFGAVLPHLGIVQTDIIIPTGNAEAASASRL